MMNMKKEYIKSIWKQYNYTTEDTHIKKITRFFVHIFATISLFFKNPKKVSWSYDLRGGICLAVTDIKNRKYNSSPFHQCKDWYDLMYYKGKLYLQSSGCC